MTSVRPLEQLVTARGVDPHRANGPGREAGTWLLALLAMLAFAANSLLCRAPLQGNAIDPMTFSLVRLISGAALLGVLAKVRGTGLRSGNWLSALALFAYVVGFSFAYVRLSAATGSLLLFGAVQVTMLGVAVARGVRLRPQQWLGLLFAVGGLFALMLPGLVTPSPIAGSSMLLAGVAWGVYSLRVNGARDPVSETAGNFLRAALLAMVLAVASGPLHHTTAIGISYAIASGALASGIGYALWYAIVPALGPIRGAIIQLTVPVFAAVGGLLFLAESLTVRLLLASLAVLGGVGLGLFNRRQATH